MLIAFSTSEFKVSLLFYKYRSITMQRKRIENCWISIFEGSIAENEKNLLKKFEKELIQKNQTVFTLKARRQKQD